MTHFVFTADQLGSQFWDHLYRKSPAAEMDEGDTSCGKYTMTNVIMFAECDI